MITKPRVLRNGIGPKTMTARTCPRLQVRRKVGVITYQLFPIPLKKKDMVEDVATEETVGSVEMHTVMFNANVGYSILAATLLATV